MLNQHHRVWTSHVGLHKQCMAEVDISHQLINIRRGRWARGRTLISSCRIRSDCQTTSLTLTTGVCEAGTKMRGAINMNTHYDVTGLLTAAWRSHSGQIAGSELIAHIQVIQVLPVADNWIDEDGLFGQRQLLVHCRHHLSTFSRLCVDISCKLYSQQLVKRRRARRCHD